MPIFLIVVIALAAWLIFGGDLTNIEQPPAPTPQIGALAAAIARQENSNPDWNNPGDLTISFGYPNQGPQNRDGVLKFDNVADGWNALYKQLSAIVEGRSRYTLQTTLADFGLAYSGGDSNWAKNVASIVGASPNDTLGDVLT